jgi:hypothetical protein
MANRKTIAKEVAATLFLIAFLHILVRDNIRFCMAVRGQERF